MKYNRIVVLLSLLTVAVGIASTQWGAVYIHWNEMISAISHFIKGEAFDSIHENIFLTIRIPRTILALLVGASLAVGGTLMQGLFRNPLVEPGLVGTSSGAALGASLYFLFSNFFHDFIPFWTLPALAFLGGLSATSLVTGLSGSKSQTHSSITHLLLIGIAVNAVCMGGVGIMSFFARDPQARSITFWGLGNLSAANWKIVSFCASAALLGIAIAFNQAKKLDALQLGEAEAQLLGVKTKRLRFTIILANIILVGIATAFVGVISFIGLIVPHILRALGIHRTRPLIITSALLGGTLLCLADLTARLVIAPAELPIGILTALVGAPVFIYLIRKNNSFFS
jgi:iron complex transport system permease protein